MKLFFFFLIPIVALATHGRSANLTLDWDNLPSASAFDSGYRLYCSKLGEKNGTQVIIIPAGETSVTLTDLEDNTAYEFCITALDDLGTESEPSNEIEATTDAATAIVPTVTVDPVVNVVTRRGRPRGTATFELSTPPVEAITVRYCLYGTDNGGSSYIPVYAQAVVPAGVTQMTINIVAPTTGLTKFFSRKANLVLLESIDQSYRASYGMISISIR